MFFYFKHVGSFLPISATRVRKKQNRNTRVNDAIDLLDNTIVCDRQIHRSPEPSLSTRRALKMEDDLLHLLCDQYRTATVRNDVSSFYGFLAKKYVNA